MRALSEDSPLTPTFKTGSGGKVERRGRDSVRKLGGGLEYLHTKLGLGIEAGPVAIVGVAVGRGGDASV